jgi:hypothetical protein
MADLGSRRISGLFYFLSFECWRFVFLVVVYGHTNLDGWNWDRGKEEISGLVVSNRAMAECERKFESSRLT